MFNRPSKFGPTARHGRRPATNEFHGCPVSRSIFALVDERDRAYFGRGGQEDDKIGFIDEKTRAIFGRSYAAEPDALVTQLAQDEAIAAADTLLLTVPNQLGVDYNAHVHRGDPDPCGPSPRLALMFELTFSFSLDSLREVIRIVSIRSRDYKMLRRWRSCVFGAMISVGACAVGPNLS